MGQLPTPDNSTVTGEVSNISAHTLEDINNETAVTLLPAMLVLGILMLVGIAGNSLVVYVFCFKLKTGTQNILIVCLAIFDLLSCTLSIPNEITDMRYFYTFPSEPACKIMRFINTFCAIGSIMTLIVIAVDRFRKICRPFKRQMHTRHVKLSLIPVLTLATVFSLPAFVMYGLRTTETHVPGLLGQDCSTPNAIGDTVLPLVYNLLLFACFIILSVTLSVLYFCILRETNRHNRYMKRNSDYSLPSTCHTNEDSSPSQDCAPEACTFSPVVSLEVMHTSSAFDYTTEPAVSLTPQTDCYNSAETFSLTKNESSPKSFTDKDNESDNLEVSSNVNSPSYKAFTITENHSNNNVQSPNRTNSSHISENIHINRKPSILISSRSDYVKKDLKIAILDPVDSFRSSSEAKPKKRRIKSKTTIIAFLVTLVFILSFLPHLSLQVAKLIHKGFDYNLSGPSLVAYNIFLRSYFINSVSNPFIYSVLNVKFSGEVKMLLKKLHCKSRE